jgi:hypothetical protein
LKYSKPSSIIAVIFLCASILAGCDLKGAKTEDAHIDLIQMGQTIIDTVNYDDSLIIPSKRAVEEMYSVDFDSIGEAAIYVSGTLATTNELIIIRLADEKYSQEVKDALNKRVEEQKASYRDYNPSELYRLDKALTLHKGRYLLFSISNDNDTVKELFFDAFKN